MSENTKQPEITKQRHETSGNQKRSTETHKQRNITKKKTEETNITTTKQQKETSQSKHPHMRRKQKVKQNTMKPNTKHIKAQTEKYNKISQRKQRN